jgi:uncharacterized protein YaaW (UPF0174 family)
MIVSGDSLIPPEIWELLRRGWGKMKPNERQQLLGKVRKERDNLKRIVIAVIAATKVLLSASP